MNNITVSTIGSKGNVSTNPDMSMFYTEKSKENADKAKEWAISDKIVDNTDYSAKYYAQKSNEQAQISTEKTEEVINSGNAALSNIVEQETISKNNIEDIGTEQIELVQNEGATQINLAKEQAMIAITKADIATAKTTEVVESGNTALENIAVAKDSALNEINLSIDSAEQYAQSALNCANNAATSESNALAYKNFVNESKEAVLISENNAKLSEINAATSEVNAQSYVQQTKDAGATAVNNITTEKENAISSINATKTTAINSINELVTTTSGYAENAQNYSNIATEQANIATTKANEACSSATSASESMTQASNYALAAKTSSEEANLSKESAAQSEANALSYKNSAYESLQTATAQATIATTQASNAQTKATEAGASASAANEYANNASTSAARCEEILARLGTAIKIKGRVDSFSNLPLSGNLDGDTYLIGEAGLDSYPEYYWYSDHWEFLGTSGTSLTDYALKSEIPTDNNQLTNGAGYITSSYHDTSKQDVISDLATIRAGAAKGATALQSVPSEYITETELSAKGYLTSYAETDPIYIADKQNLAKIDLSNLSETGTQTIKTVSQEELNNPFSLFDSKYSDHELCNVSWLRSEGQWNSGAVYVDAYDKLLKVYNGIETVEGLSVKLSTEDYTDYDFVLNTADETFRLPLNSNPKSVIDTYVNGTNGYRIWSDGYCEQWGSYTLSSNNSNIVITYIKTFININYNIIVCKQVDNTFDKSVYAPKIRTKSTTGFVGACNTDVANSLFIWKASGYLAEGEYVPVNNNNYLYYYVGETVKNANLIDAGRLGEQLANKTDMLQASAACMPSSQYVDLTLGANGDSYTAPANGWFTLVGVASTSGTTSITNLSNGLVDCTSYNGAYYPMLSLPVLKGDKARISINNGTLSIPTSGYFRFVYAQGAKEV